MAVTQPDKRRGTTNGEPPSTNFCWADELEKTEDNYDQSCNQEDADASARETIPFSGWFDRYLHESDLAYSLNY